MEHDNYLPRTLQSAIVYYANPDNALRCMIGYVWPDGVTCPHCNSREHSFLATRRIWKCKGCRRQFSVKVGTIMEDSPLGLDKWICAMWMIANAKNGISSYEIHRGIGVTQKTAWFLLHRIRLGMKAGTFRKLSGEIEADETFIGGLESNKHMSKRVHKGRGAVGKAIVLGLFERNGEMRATVVPDTKKETLQAQVRANVVEGSEVHTDALASYEGLDDAYVHEVVNHAHEYVRGNVTTNRLENFFSLLKRTLKGTYVCVAPYHLLAYLDEQVFRFNARKVNDSDRFRLVASSIKGKRVTYKQLIGDIR